MSNKINRLCFFCPFFFFCFFFFTIHTSCHLLLFILWCLCRCLLCILSLFALVTPSFGIAAAKRKKKLRSKATDRTSVWIFWYFIVFVPVSRKSFLWRETWRDSQKSPINILIPKTLSSLVQSPYLKVLLCWKKRIFGLVESGFSPAEWRFLQCPSSPGVSQLGQNSRTMFTLKLLNLKTLLKNNIHFQNCVHTEMPGQQEDSKISSQPSSHLLC